ncbi:MAG: hypothetical protein K6U74_20125 [Firmicutes bacterium]|nr:hypothetical protein [Bacillota bacterium]
MIRRKAWLAILLVFAAAIAGYAGLAGAADRGEPGSSLDPLVTKSFVEKYVKEILGTGGSGEFQWQIKNLTAGQEFICGTGTEFIVRTGDAVVIDPGGSGIPDVTAGVNVTNGKPAARNHLFIVPRSDGRGILAQTAVIVMYRGGGVK